MAVAGPVLASALWAANDQQFSNANKLLCSRCHGIDLTLEGGLAYGERGVCCITGEGGALRDLAQRFMTSHLLATSDATVTVIDSTLNFDVQKLHLNVTNLMTVDHPTLDSNTLSEKGMDTLSRVKIMKVLDFIGLSEAFVEVQAEVERLATLPPRGTVEDSEDESEDILDRGSTQRHKLLSHKARHLLLIDDITTLVAPMLERNLAQGQALLSSLMRSLRHLTHANEMSTVVLSTVDAPLQGYKRRYDAPNVGHTELSSIFSSCEVKHVLGQNFQWLVDLQLLVHSDAKRELDAQALYGQHSRLRRDGKEAEMVNVIEVLFDRFGDRHQRWAAFDRDTAGVVIGVR